MRQRLNHGLLAATCAGLLLAAAAPAHAIKPADIAIPGNPNGNQIQTVADAKLRADVLNMIATYEGATGNGSRLTLQTARGLGKNGASFLERWMLTGNGKSVVYRVKLTPVATGGVDFAVEKLPN